MRRLLKYNSLRNLMQQFPRQNYCVYRHVHDVNLYCIPNCFTSSKAQRNFSAVSFPHDLTENIIAELQEEFPEPKNILYQVLNEAFLRDQTLDLKPVIHTEQILSDCNNEYIWKTVVKMKWPETFEVEAMAKRKTEALNVAFLYVCQKLKKLDVLDHSNKPALQKRKISDHDINTAKGNLLNICHRMWHRSGNKDSLPKFNTKPYQGVFGNYWQTELEVTFPEKKIFKAVAFRSSASEGIAAFEALLWLQNQGIINKKGRVLDYTKADEEKLKDYHQAPYSLSLPPALQDKMQNVLAQIEEKRLLLSNKESIEFIDPIKEEKDDDHNIRDIISEKPYYQLTEEELHAKSQILYQKNKSTAKKIMLLLTDTTKAKSLLPISPKREEILKLIDENQVVILSGDTGCGKSTQVPQFILDHYINNMKGAECNIIVTQPRRISTVALAHRVAKERHEKVGKRVGYHIRFNKYLPESNGAILYCTTGILLRKLLTNPNLKGISHVIIDEIHERNINIDFVLILLKNILKNNKNIKLLLMSASFNTSLFAQYFNGSPVIHIPGKTYPVEEFFLEDLKEDIPSIKNVEHREAVIDVNLIVDVINYIDEKQPPGAILCFLPGWHEIRTIQNKLEKQANISKLMICPIHSRLPHEEQKNIFLKPPDNQRKVILATNVAETSITIDDVVYVVNSGLQKGTLLDVEVGMASLSTQWVTKANVRQRKGRAGRVMPGKCYHLFSWKTFMKMEEYPVAEILRMPLEAVILDCKLFCQGMKAEEFLSQGLQSPATSAIQNGVNELQILRVLDESENLTDLGKTIVHFASHPRLSVALVYATFLKCLDPVLTICATLALEKEPFINTLDDKIQIKEIKTMHDNNLCSDHLSLTAIYDTWNSLSEDDVAQFLEKYLLDDQSLVRIKQLKKLFIEDLLPPTSLIREEDFSTSNFDRYNIHSSHVPSILAAITAAFFPNVIKVLQGEISQGKLNKDSLVYSIIKGQKAYIQKESVASEAEELPTPWLTYFSALKSEARRKAMVSSLSSIPGICLLLFILKLTKQCLI